MRSFDDAQVCDAQRDSFLSVLLAKFVTARYSAARCKMSVHENDVRRTGPAAGSDWGLTLWRPLKSRAVALATSRSRASIHSFAIHLARFIMQ